MTISLCELHVSDYRKLKGFASEGSNNYADLFVGA